jgi:hypothetical protein
VKVADLVDEDRPAVGRFELADLELAGAREGPAFMAEKHAPAAQFTLTNGSLQRSPR